MTGFEPAVEILFRRREMRWANASASRETRGARAPETNQLLDAPDGDVIRQALWIFGLRRKSSGIVRAVTSSMSRPDRPARSISNRRKLLLKRSTPPGASRRVAARTSGT